MDSSNANTAASSNNNYNYWIKVNSKGAASLLSEEYDILSELEVPGLPKVVKFVSNVSCRAIVFEKFTGQLLTSGNRFSNMIEYLDFAIALFKLTSRIHDAGYALHGLQSNHIVWDAPTKTVSLLDVSCAKRVVTNFTLEEMQEIAVQNEAAPSQRQQSRAIPNEIAMHRKISLFTANRGDLLNRPSGSSSAEPQQLPPPPQQQPQQQQQQQQQQKVEENDVDDSNSNLENVIDDDSDDEDANVDRINYSWHRTRGIFDAARCGTSAPEQLWPCDNFPDFRTDQYIIGCILYELAAGRLPFPTGEPSEVILAHGCSKPGMPEDVPGCIVDVLTKLLTKDARERYRSIKACVKSLRLCQKSIQNVATNAVIERPPIIIGKISKPDMVWEDQHRKIKEILNSAHQKASAKQGPSIVFITGGAGVGKATAVRSLRSELSLGAECKLNKARLEDTQIVAITLYESLVAAGWSPKDETSFNFPTMVRNCTTPQDVKKILQNWTDAAEKSAVVSRPSVALLTGISSTTCLSAGCQALLQYVCVEQRERFQHLMIVITATIEKDTPSDNLVTMEKFFQEISCSFDVGHLSSLSEWGSVRLIANALDTSVSYTRPLARAIHQKTHGNVKDSLALLAGLEHAGVLQYNYTAFSPKSRDHHSSSSSSSSLLSSLSSLSSLSDSTAGRWEWHLSSVMQSTIGPTAAILLADRLQQIQQGLHRKALAIAGVIGLVFSPSLVTKILSRPEINEPSASACDSLSLFTQALELGLVERVNDNEHVPVSVPLPLLRFVHARIRDVARALDPISADPNTEIAAGLSLLGDHEMEDAGISILAIARHMNAAFQLLSAEKSSVKLTIEVAITIASANLAASRYSLRHAGGERDERSSTAPGANGTSGGASAAGGSGGANSGATGGGGGGGSGGSGGSSNHPVDSVIITAAKDGGMTGKGIGWKGGFQEALRFAKSGIRVLTCVCKSWETSAAAEILHSLHVIAINVMHLLGRDSESELLQVTLKDKSQAAEAVMTDIALVRIRSLSLRGKFSESYHVCEENIASSVPNFAFNIAKSAAEGCIIINMHLDTLRRAGGISKIAKSIKGRQMSKHSNLLCSTMYSSALISTEHLLGIVDSVFAFCDRKGFSYDVIPATMFLAVAALSYPRVSSGNRVAVTTLTDDTVSFALNQAFAALALFSQSDVEIPKQVVALGSVVFGSYLAISGRYAEGPDLIRNVLTHLYAADSLFEAGLGCCHIVNIQLTLGTKLHRIRSEALHLLCLARDHLNAEASDILTGIIRLCDKCSQGSSPSTAQNTQNLINTKDQTTSPLKGDAALPVRFATFEMTDKEFHEHLLTRSEFCQAQYLCNYEFVLFLNEEIPEAYATCITTDRILEHVGSYLHTVKHCFVFGLVLSWFCRQETEEAKRTEMIPKIEEMLGRLQVAVAAFTGSQGCDDVFTVMVLLLRAEVNAFSCESAEESARVYIQAITTAKACSCWYLCGLASQLLATHFLQLPDADPRDAERLLWDAHKYLMDWGATIRAGKIREKFPQVFATKPVYPNPMIAWGVGSSLCVPAWKGANRDNAEMVAAVVADRISTMVLGGNEPRGPELLADAVMRATGSDLVGIVVLREGDPWVAAEASLRDRSKNTGSNPRFSTLMVDHVSKTLETLVIANAMDQSSLFARDPYTKAREIRSVIVSPFIAKLEGEKPRAVGACVCENSQFSGVYGEVTKLFLQKLLPRLCEILPQVPLARRNTRMVSKTLSDVVSVPPSQLKPAVMTRGFLIKRGAIIKNWKRRFFILRNQCLYYYETPDSQEAIKGIQLDQMVTVESVDNSELMRIGAPTPYCFCVTAEGRHYFMCTDDAELLNMWIEGIRQHVHKIEDRGAGQVTESLQPTVGPALEDLRLEKVIGQGGFAVVYRGQLHGTTVAVKRLCLEFTEQNIALFRREAKLMSEVRHPNILLYMGAQLNPPEVFIITEFMPRGSLFTVLQDPSVRMTWPLRVKMALDAACGMLYLHSVSPPLIHRDLKTENLLVDNELRVKVSDFGLTRLTGFRSTTFVAQKSDTFVTSNVGSIRYSAPEVLSEEHFSEYNEKVDCYAFGMVLWEMVSRKRPFYDLPANRQKIEKAIKSGKRPTIDPSTPPLYASLIRDCWHEKPLKRPAFPEILARLRKMSEQLV